MASAENSAELPAGAASEGAAARRLRQALHGFRALDPRRKMAAGVALALLFALVVGVLGWKRGPDYAVLFSSLDERDGGQIIAALQQQNVPYRMSPAGTAILVPAAQVHETRLRLAAAGLPRGGLAGFELMDGQKLGISQFSEQVNYQRALEGELSRTVQSIAAVGGARVHLAIPKQTAFLRDDQRPTASVMVNLRPGRVLDANQVSGIVHLVSSSVPRMTAAGVSIVDQNGELLTARTDPLLRTGLNATQLDYVRAMERQFVERVDNILTPIVGKGNFRAQVAADVDFSQVEQTAETYKPNPAPDQAIRSQQTSELINPAPGAQGVPGALSNQPPVPATAPITMPGVAQGAAAALPAAPGSNRSALLNYELDRSIQHVRQAVGQLRRLSVAVVVNHRSTVDADGAPAMVALSDDELARITNLVREAVGYNADRGDSIKVANSAFATEPLEAAPPLWKDPEMLELGKQGLHWLLVALLLLFAWLAVLRPLLRTVLPAAPVPATAAGADVGAEDEDEDAIVQLGAQPDRQQQAYLAHLEQARQLARDDPRLAATLIKAWMGVSEDGRK